jgi:DNA-binding response OmpR family regulator
VAGRKQILVIEDDRAIHHAITTLLEHYEFDVTLARTLAEGKKALAAKPDLIVLDVILPDGDGLDLLDYVRTRGLKTRVVVLTGSTHSAHEQRIRRLKPDRYFRKPLNFIELLAGIREDLSAPPSPAKVVAATQGIAGRNG